MPAGTQRRRAVVTSNDTVVIGFDALDFEYLDQFAEELPNFRKLRSRGVESPLQSTMPPWTGSAWPSMYTGTEPGQHGVYDFFDHSEYPDTAAISSRNDVHQPALWNYLTADNRPSVVLNLPVTHPAEEMEGVLIPGYLAPENSASSPPSARSELSDAIGEDYRIYSSGETADDGEMKRQGYLDLIDLRERAAVALLTDYEWDLAILQVQKTDSVFHNFEDTASFRQIYQAADRFLGSVLDTVPESTNIVVCSDHGIGHKDGYAIYINEILRQHGFVEETLEGEQASLGESKQQLLEDEQTKTAEQRGSNSGLLGQTTLAASSALRTIGIGPADIYSAAGRVGLQPLLESAVPDGVKQSMAKIVDWRASKAYSRSTAELGIRINLSGREPDGVVPPTNYEAIRDELIELLERVETPDGEPAFEFVKRREEIYDGPHVEDACDIVFLPTDMNHIIETKLYGREFVPIDRYDHERSGVFIAAGPDIQTSTVPELSLVDVAPFVLALLGQPVPDRMSGTVPTDLLDLPVSYRRYDGLSFGGAGQDANGTAEVTDRLEDLGYL